MKTLTSILICLFAVSLAAKPLNKGNKYGHEADIYSVLPFAKCDRIDELIQAIHNTIDLPVGYFEGLRNPPHKDFTWHDYGHRVFFHWGFNSNPRSSKILQSLVSERNWSSETEKSFWDKVIREQSRRNLEVMTETGRILGFSLSGQHRAYVNAFASIIVDVHILGDYSTTNREALMNLDLVVSDLKQALYNRLKGENEAKGINKKLDSTKSIADEQERAVAILTILQSELPEFIVTVQNGFFKQHFMEMGFELK